MVRIPVTTARLQIADLVSRVQYTGERIILTKHGKPAAMLVPVDAAKAAGPARAKGARGRK
jgi:prevent-host-death family protein